MCYPIHTRAIFITTEVVGYLWFVGGEKTREALEGDSMFVSGARGTLPTRCCCGVFSRRNRFGVSAGGRSAWGGSAPRTNTQGECHEINIDPLNPPSCGSSTLQVFDFRVTNAVTACCVNLRYQGDKCKNPLSPPYQGGKCDKPRATDVRCQGDVWCVLCKGRG
jgi:hypothetical protein